jgi:hypothetical protein
MAQTREAIFAEFDAIADPMAKTLFYQEHKRILSRPRSLASAQHSTAGQLPIAQSTIPISLHDQFEAIADPVEKTLFYRAHKAVLSKPRYQGSAELAKLNAEASRLEAEIPEMERNYAKLTPAEKKVIDDEIMRSLVSR